MAQQGSKIISAWAFQRAGYKTAELLRRQASSPISIPDIWIDWWFAAGITYYGILKRWAGATWIKEPLKTYLASSWQSKPLKRWDGTEWKEIDSTGI